MIIKKYDHYLEHMQSLNIIIKNNNEHEKMTCNDYLTLQKSPLFNLNTADAHHYLNPFGELLFSQKWKWSQLHLPGQKIKISSSQSLPSLKKDILLWFENLSAIEKIAVTTIGNSTFCESFLKMLPQRSTNRLFNLNSQQWIDSIDVGDEDPFFDELLSELRIGYLSEPLLYIHKAQIMGIKMLNWLNKVTSSRVFQYASKSKSGQENPLWFSSHSYHYLQSWLANQLQINIVKHFLNKSVPEHIIPQMQTHLKGIGRNNEAHGLALSLKDVRKKSKGQISNLRQKIKDEEQKFMEARQQRLLSCMEMAEKTKKKNKKKTKLKNSEKKVLEDSQNQNRSPEKQPELKLPQRTSKIAEKKKYKSKSKEKQIQTLQTKVESPPHPKQIQKVDAQNDKERQSDISSKRSTSKNLIRVSPKRRRSPEQVRSKQLFESQIREKYSEEDKVSASVTQSERFSDTLNSYDDFGIQEKQTVKKRRKRGKKQCQKLNETKQILFNRLVNRQIDGLVDDLGYQTNALYNHKIIAFERIRTFVQSFYPMTNAILFGSNAVGLSLPNSDVDILLTCMNCYGRQIASDMLAQIAVEINAMGWVVSCATYLWAKVPLVKLEIDTTIPFMQTKRKQDLFRVYNPAAIYHLDHHTEDVLKTTIKVDITMNIEGVTSAGYQSTQLMRNWISKIPFVQKLIILFKHILFIRNYNSNFAGGIGSYCLFVMIVAFIKNKNLEESAEISDIFQQLLKWYGEDFDNLVNVIQLSEEGLCYVNQSVYKYDFEDCKVGLLKIIDPITGRLMSSSCNEYVNIKIEFRRILYELRSWKDQIEQQLKISNLAQPELVRIATVKKSMDKWLTKFQNKYELSLKNLIERSS